MVLEPHMGPVALLLLGLRLAFAGKHTLQYFYTVVSGAENLTECTAVGLIDGQQFMYFDSNTMKVVPKTEWIRQNEEEDYWKTQSQILTINCHKYTNDMKIIKDRFNHSTTKGVHTLQVMYGCELDDDGNTQAHYEYGYDGEDYISFDKNTLTWTAAVPQAYHSKLKWEGNLDEKQYWKRHLENICIIRLKKFVINSYKAPPQVSLLQRNFSSPVECHATGFYPSNIMMSWKKNHEDVYEDVELSSTLPNEDGTFQRSIRLSVEAEEWKKNPDVYRCVIQHVGAATEIVVLLNDRNIRSNTVVSDNTIGLTVGCLVAVSIIAAIMGVIVWWKTRRIVSSDSIDALKDSKTDVSEQSDEPMLKK